MRAFVTIVIVASLARSAAADHVLRRADWGYEVVAPDSAEIALDGDQVQVPLSKNVTVYITHDTAAKAAASREGDRTLATNLKQKIEDLGDDTYDGMPRHRTRFDGRYEKHYLKAGADRVFMVTIHGRNVDDLASVPVHLRAITTVRGGSLERVVVPSGGFWYDGPSAFIIVGETTVSESTDAGLSWSVAKVEVTGNHAQNGAVMGRSLVFVRNTEIDPDVTGTQAIRVAAGATKIVYDEPTKTIATFVGTDGIERAGFITYDHELVTTSDGGTTWTVHKLTDKKLARTRLNELDVQAVDGAWYVTTQKSTNRSLDGAAFVKVADKLLTITSAEGRLVANSGKALLESTDHGVTWKALTTAKSRISTVQTANRRTFVLTDERALLELVGRKLVPPVGWTPPEGAKVFNMYPTGGALLVGLARGGKRELYRFVP